MVVTDPPARPLVLGKPKASSGKSWPLTFFPAPPLDRQDDEQKRRHKAALRRLLRLENRSILQAAGLPRPLSQGDLAVLLRALLDACLQTLGAARQRDSAVPLMSVQIAEGFPLREAAASSPPCPSGRRRPAARRLPGQRGRFGGRVPVRPERTFTCTVTGERPPAEAEALAVAEETARLHKGGLARLFRHRWAVAVHQPAGGRGAVCRPHPDPAAAGHPVGRAGGSLFVAGIKVLEDVVHRGLLRIPAGTRASSDAGRFFPKAWTKANSRAKAPTTPSITPASRLAL